MRASAQSWELPLQGRGLKSAAPSKKVLVAPKADLDSAGRCGAMPGSVHLSGHRNKFTTISTIHLSLARHRVKELLCIEPYPTASSVSMSVIPHTERPRVLCWHHRKAIFLDFGCTKHCFGQAVGLDADLHYTSGTLITVELLQARTAGTDEKLVRFWPCFQACLPEIINKPTTNRSFALHAQLSEKYRRQGQGTLKKFLKDAGTSYKCFACAFRRQTFLGEKKKMCYGIQLVLMPLKSSSWLF